MLMASPMPKVGDLVNRAVKGILDIPEFQRGFVWSPEKVKNFVESLWREYPVGLILLWSYPEYFSPRTAKGSQIPKLWIVDGQQRLTALCLVFNQKPYWWKDTDEWNQKIEKYHYFRMCAQATLYLDP